MRLAAMAVVGIGVAAVEMIPVGVGAVATFDPAKCHAELVEFLPLLTDLLALVVRHCGEEVVEAAVARIVPVELEAAAVHQRRRVERGMVRLGGE